MDFMNMYNFMPDLGGYFDDDVDNLMKKSRKQLISKYVKVFEGAPVGVNWAGCLVDKVSEDTVAEFLLDYDEDTIERFLDYGDWILFRVDDKYTLISND
jgi:hypothetical protein